MQSQLSNDEEKRTGSRQEGKQIQRGALWAMYRLVRRSSQLLRVWVGHMEPPTLWNNPTKGKRKRDISARSLPAPPSNSCLLWVKVYLKRYKFAFILKLCHTALQESHYHTALHLSPKWWKEPKPLWIQSAQTLALEQLWLFPGKVWHRPCKGTALVFHNGEWVRRQLWMWKSPENRASSRAPSMQQGSYKSG